MPQLVQRAAASGEPAPAGSADDVTTVGEQLGGMSAEHLVERRGLLLIIVFGESVIAIGIGAGPLPRTIGHLGEQVATGPALVLAGGVAVYLAGDLAFRSVLGIGPARFRAAATVLVLATVPLGATTAGLWQLLALVVVLLCALGAETRWAPTAAVRPTPPRGSG
ncbi:hypothetical protein [Streptomyces sp. NPDC051109]|uniref:hypothetical protein n=1 Tax=Streptomyces sp. NPDC051109 TaxID=3365642 RepID=UPI0037A0652B